jgi:hypothetical protein
VAAILDFANKTVSDGADLGAYQKSKKYGMGNI